MKAVISWIQHQAASDLILGSVPAGVSLYWLLFGAQRSDFAQVLGLWMLLFVLYGWWLIRSSHLEKKEESHLDLRSRWGLGLSIALRVIASLAVPMLSDDYFRFLWDGQLLLQGINPFTVLPSTLAAAPQQLESLGLSAQWFLQLNSPDYFTIYPPILQGIFMLGASAGSILGGVWVMKAVVLAGEITTLFLLRQLLVQLGKPSQWVLWYGLNPLVIVELCGSLHFEALMIPFLLAAVHLLLRKKLLLSSIFLGLSVATKLLPLMFLPFLLWRLGWKRAFLYATTTGITVLLLFSPLLSEEMIMGFRKSLELYVNRFEFNASIWYVIRWFGYQDRGWNIIREVGPQLSQVAAVLILLGALLERNAKAENWPGAILFSLVTYFLLSLIVHPWYITTLVALAPLTGQRFPLIWSLWLPWTYLAYRSDPVEESMWLIMIEYGSVLLWMAIENKAWRWKVSRLWKSTAWDLPAWIQSFWTK